MVLVAGSLLARLAGFLGVRLLGTWVAAARVGLAVMFFFTAAAHFNSLRGDLVRMVPPSVPAPEAVITFTGICEVLGAIGLLVPQTRRLAAFALILFLLAVLPANIHAARTDVTIGGSQATPLVPRIALQALFIGLVWWSGIRDPVRQRVVDGERAGTRSQAGPKPDQG